MQAEIRLPLKGWSDHGVHSRGVCIQSASFLGFIGGSGDYSKIGEGGRLGL